MANLNKEKKFLRDLWLIPSLIIIILGFIFFLIISYKNVIETETKFETTKEKIIGREKESIKINIDNIINHLNFKDKYAEKKLKNYIKEQTNIGYFVIEGIYKNNKNRNKKFIITLIKEALRDVRFNHNRGYYFIYNYLNNKNILLPIAPNLEERNFSNYKDIKGHYVIKDMSSIAINKGEGFYSWYWKKPNNPNVNFKKIGFIKAFKPLNIFIGTGEYLDDFIKDLQKNILIDFKYNKNFNKNKLFILHNNHLILNNTDSKIDLNQELKLKDKNGITLQNKLIEKAKNGGGFVEFNYLNSNNKLSKKLFYIKDMKKWNWIIVEEINFNQINNVLNATHKILKKQLNDTILYTALFIVLLIIIFVILLKNFSQKTALQFIEYKKKTEIEKEKSKAKELFLANMSHEIRTPLNAIIGFIDILQENVKDMKNSEYLRIIKDSSESLLQIINDILDFSKIESGKLEIEKHPFEPKKEFKTITNLFDARASKKNINLILDIDKNIAEVLISDPLRIKQVIANLISNAIKFTPEGKNIIVSINYKNNHLFVSVKDEGIGIPKDKQEKIFGAFSQENNSIARKYGGTGLGLAISSKLIELLGGELKLKSEVGKGSEFYFSIPANIGKVEKKKEDISHNLDNLKGKKILLVEDNQANQMFMKILLKKLGFDFDIANDGLEAVEKFKTNKYDFILMDENMPNMNGIEATKKILEYEKENNLPHTPIIALTANAIKGDRERFLSAGMDEYLTKPLNKKDLIKTLSQFI